MNDTTAQRRHMGTTSDALTDRQRQRIEREARRLTREWQADCIKTSRPMTEERAGRIARQQALYMDHVAKGKTDTIAAIFFAHLSSLSPRPEQEG